jgi:pimeloyl-ACP methyl ester carboxylesterase
VLDAFELSGRSVAAPVGWLAAEVRRGDPDGDLRLVVGASRRSLEVQSGGVSRSYRVPGLVLIEHEFELPLDHDRPDGPKLTVFAREVAASEGLDRPYLVFFEGGPGHEAARPLKPDVPEWLKRALQDYRLLLLDQRGTGRSTPVGALPGSAEEQAAYLRNFRADAIVRDAEAVRRLLGVERWSVLGQSFGGFCVCTYLSFHPEGLREAFVTGGLPPLDLHVDDVYRATYELTRRKASAYFDRYPDDRERLRALEEVEPTLPSGDRLTARRARQLGNLLGMSDGFERLHYLLELPFDAPAFLHDLEAAYPFTRNPLYAIIHEACYANGCATQWSAERLLPNDLELTGEHVFAWMFEDYGALRPLADAARLLAEEQWPPLYDAERLRANEVPAAAVIYADDMYVPRQFSEQTASAIRGLRPWITNEYEHDGLRADGERVLGRLIALARGHA